MGSDEEIGSMLEEFSSIGTGGSDDIMVIVRDAGIEP